MTKNINRFSLSLFHIFLFSGIQKKLDKGLRPGTVTQGVLSMTKKVQLVTSKLDQAHGKAREIEAIVIASIAFDNRYCHALTLNRSVFLTVFRIRTFFPDPDRTFFLNPDRPDPIRKFQIRIHSTHCAFLVRFLQNLTKNII